MLEKFERYPLTFGPTPIETLRRLSSHLGGNVEIYAKREDCNSGLALGGNKIRKLEYIVPDAIASNADTEIQKSLITAAQENATSEGKEWITLYQSDPASEAKVARWASVESNDGLCKLTVEERLNGVRLTEINCPLIEISPYDGLEVKFDFLPTSYRLPLKNFSDSSRVFIPSSHYDCAPSAPMRQLSGIE